MKIISAIFGISILAALILYFQRLDTEKINKNIKVKEIQMEKEINSFNQDFHKSLSNFSETKEEKKYHNEKSNEAKQKNEEIEKKEKEEIKKLEVLEKKSNDVFNDLEKQMKDFNSKPSEKDDFDNDNFDF